MDACDRAVLTSDGEDVGPPVVAGHAAVEATQIVATAGNGPESCMPMAGSRFPQSPCVKGAVDGFRNSITLSVGLPVHDDLGHPLCQVFLHRRVSELPVDADRRNPNSFRSFAEALLTPAGRRRVTSPLMAGPPPGTPTASTLGSAAGSA